MKNYNLKKILERSEGRISYLEDKKNLIDCSLGQSPYGYSHLVDKSLNNINSDQIVGYQENFNDPNLINQLMYRWGKYGISENNIFLGHGIYNILERIIHKLFDKCHMLGYGPQFNEIPSESLLSGGSYNAISMCESFNFPLEEMLTEINHNAKYNLIFIDNPNNPTGQLISLNKIEQIVATAERKNILVVVDEAYGDFIEDEFSAIKLVNKYENLMVVRSFSKTLGLASLRVGHAIVSDNIAPYYRKIDVPFEPGILGSIAATSALKDLDFLHNTRKNVANEKSILIKGLKKLGIKILPTHLNTSIFTAYSQKTNLYQIFKDCSIKVISGQSFKNTNYKLSSHYVRIRVPGSIKLCHEILDRLGKWFDHDNKYHS